MKNLSTAQRSLLICCTVAGLVLGAALASADFNWDKLKSKEAEQEEVIPDDRYAIYREIMDTAKKNNPKLTSMELLEIAQSVYQSSLEFDMDYKLILAVIKKESHFRIKAVSSKGAQGLMQVMPKTGQICAKELGLENYQLTDISTNIRLGTYYLKQLMDRYEDQHSALTAYNRGPTGLKRYITRTGTSESKYSQDILGYVHP